jgi:prepilin signal peptidase PulO-like enzyme (type II secretory pathway)
MTSLLLFVFGLIMGSFLNVIAVRYNPDKFILHSDSLGGRSHCPHCGKQLKWWELIPLVSYLVQGGLCRSCRKSLSWGYPLAEIVCGLIFLLIPLKFGLELFPASLPILWILVFLSLFLITLIDLRLRIIPDELNVFILILSFFIIFLESSSFTSISETFIGHYALLFGGKENIWLNHFFGFLFGLGFFLILILLSRGRGMGMGDMKLAAALGFLFGWPDILIIIPFSFILGSLLALPLLLSGRRKRKDFLPFGPFLALGSALIFFWGFPIVNFYFSLFRG